MLPAEFGAPQHPRTAGVAAAAGAPRFYTGRPSSGAGTPPPHAQHTPDKAARIVADSGPGVRWCRRDGAWNRLATCSRRRGVGAGDRIAPMLQSRPRCVEVCPAAQRAGIEPIALCCERLPAAECPRSSGFAAELPRPAAGGLYEERRLRDAYWPGMPARSTEGKVWQTPQ